MLKKILALPVVALILLLTNPSRTIILGLLSLSVGFVSEHFLIRLVGFIGAAALFATLPGAFRNYRQSNDNETIPNKAASLLATFALWANLTYEFLDAHATNFYFILAIGILILPVNIHALVNDFLFVRTIKRDGAEALARRMIQKNIDASPDDFEGSMADAVQEAINLRARSYEHWEFFEGAHRDERIRQRNRHQEHEEMLADAVERHG